MNNQVSINGQTVSLESGQCLADLLQQFGAQEPYVIAINEIFVPRSAYAQQPVQAGDRIEVLQPIQGG